MATEKIAGQKVPTWNAVAPEDLEMIVNENIIKSSHVSPPPLPPGLCPKCRNLLDKCMCKG